MRKGRKIVLLVGRVSVCIYYCSNIFPHADKGCSREKILAKLFAHTTIGILSTLTYTEFDRAALLAML